MTTPGTSFQYADSPDPVRSDLVEAYRRAWDHVAAPGTWLEASERVAVADETRRALTCALCRERKAALSPFTVEGEHDHAGILSAPIVDAIHRVTTDAARLTESWYRSLLDQGLTPETYVEVLGISVIVISVDRFHRAMGIPLEDLPDPLPGEPSRERPDGIVEGEAWVPMLNGKQAAKTMGLPAPSAPFVIRALSLVPAELKAWQDVSAAQYLAPDQMLGFGSVRKINRSQIELVAGRVSSLNECFY
jgi:alkylhydroperoxidase family enzyme